MQTVKTSAVTVNVRIPYNEVLASDILSDQDQTKLIQLRDVIRDCYFDVGDIANRNVEMGGDKIGAGQIYDAVGRFVGKSERTIRYYAETAAFYPQAVRLSFDILPFSFFVYAKTQHDRWLEILDYAMLKPHLSLSGLKTYFSTSVEGTKSDQNYKVGGVSSVNNPQGQERPFNKLPPTKFSKMLMLSTLSDLLDIVRKVMGCLNLSDSVEKRLIRSVNDIQNVIPEIVNSVDAD